MDNMKNLLANANPFESRKKAASEPPPNTAYDEENPFESGDFTPSPSPSPAPPSSASAASSSAPPKKKKKNPVSNAASAVGTAFTNATASVTGKKAKAPASASAYSYVDTNAEDDGGAAARELAIREANLKAREAKMLEKEQEVEKRENSIKNREGQAHNWPFRFYAITYHSISDDIPPEHQKLCRDYYLMIRFFWFVLVWNFITMTTCLVQGSGSLINFIFAGFYLIVGIVGSWQLWYKSLYYSLKSKAALKWMAFYISFVLHILFVILGFIGYIATGGIMQLLSTLSGGATASILFCVVCTIFWGVEMLLSTWLFKRARDTGKKSGGDTKSLQSGMASQAIKMQLTSR